MASKRKKISLVYGPDWRDPIEVYAGRGPDPFYERGTPIGTIKAYRTLVETGYTGSRSGDTVHATLRKALAPIIRVYRETESYWQRQYDKDEREKKLKVEREESARRGRARRRARW